MEIISVNPLNKNIITKPLPKKRVSVPFKSSFFNDFDNFVKNSGKTTPVISSNVSEKGLNFGRELAQIAKNPNFSYNDVKILIDKHLPNNNIFVHPMSDYTRQGPVASNPKEVSAVTRTTFDMKGNLEKIDLFIPDFNVNNKANFVEFIDKTTHEVTHAIQYSNNKKIIDSHIPDGPGKFMNFVEKQITDFFTQKVITDCSKKLIIANKYPMKSWKDYDAFMDKTIDKPVSEEEIRALSDLPKDKLQFKSFFNNFIFNKIYDGLLKKMNYQQNDDFKVLLNRYGSYEKVKEHIKEISKNRMLMEYEAWSTGIEMRKELLGTKGKPCYYDIIPTIFKFTAEAL